MQVNNITTANAKGWYNETISDLINDGIINDIKVIKVCGYY
jgi:hypothetical protein